MCYLVTQRLCASLHGRARGRYAVSAACEQRTRTEEKIVVSPLVGQGDLVYAELILATTIFATLMKMGLLVNPLDG